jgi:cell division protein FtsB
MTDGILNKLTRVVIFLVLLAGAMLMGIKYYPLFKQNQNMRAESLRLDAQTQQEEETNKALRNAIDSLRDPRTVERMARERLGYARTGEIVFHFEPTASTNGPALR